MKVTLTITLKKADGSEGPKPDDGDVISELRDQVEGLAEVWVDDYGYEILDTTLIEGTTV